ncbi:MAG: cobalamin-dependent protein [Desulfobacterium sp.]|nr:cobalamin-dependent protein [Desulfobacterium sp.]
MEAEQMGGITTALFQALISVDKAIATELLTAEYSKNGFKETGEVITQVLEEIGNGWEQGSVSLAQVYMSGIIVEEVVKKIFPQNEEVVNTLPVLGTAVFLDCHGLGMKIVKSLVKSKGYPVIDMGLGADVDLIVETILEKNIQILLLSVLMLPSALAIKGLKEKLGSKSPGVKLVVGGAPFRLDETLGTQVGAHAYCRNAGEIFGVLNRLQKEGL